MCLAIGKASSLTEKSVVSAIVDSVAEPAAAITVDAGIDMACANEVPVVASTMP